MVAHSPATLQRLEQVAAASQSGRTVLIEGDTCCGKTQLVVELARLAQQQLVVVNLTSETGVLSQQTTHPALLFTACCMFLSLTYIRWFCSIQKLSNFFTCSSQSNHCEF